MPETEARVTGLPGWPHHVGTGIHFHWLWSEVHRGSFGDLHYDSQGTPWVGVTGWRGSGTKAKPHLLELLDLGLLKVGEDVG